MTTDQLRQHLKQQISACESNLDFHLRQLENFREDALRQSPEQRGESLQALAREAVCASNIANKLEVLTESLRLLEASLKLS